MFQIVYTGFCTSNFSMHPGISPVIFSKHSEKFLPGIFSEPHRKFIRISFIAAGILSEFLQKFLGVPPEISPEFILDVIHSCFRSSSEVPPKVIQQHLQQILWSFHRNFLEDLQEFLQSSTWFLFKFLRESLQISSEKSFRAPPGIPSNFRNSSSRNFYEVYQGILQSSSCNSSEILWIPLGIFLELLREFFLSSSGNFSRASPRISPEFLQNSFQILQDFMQQVSPELNRKLLDEIYKKDFLDKIQGSCWRNSGGVSKRKELRRDSRWNS